MASGCSSVCGIRINLNHKTALLLEDPDISIKASGELTPKGIQNQTELMIRGDVREGRER